MTREEARSMVFDLLDAWIVEIDYGGINWQPICYCVSQKQAKDVVARPHIIEVGKPVRVRQYGTLQG
jgi:hypothetical protein